MISVNADKCIQIGPWRFDAQTNRLLGNDSKHELEPQLVQLLLYLIDHRNEVLTRDQLITEAWPGVVSDAAINQAVAKLRKLLQDDARNPQFIETIAKKGYRFIAQIRVEATPHQAFGSDSKTSQLKMHENEPVLNFATRKSSTLQRLVAHSLALAAGMGLLIIVTLIYYLLSSLSTESTPGNGSTLSQPVTSIAGEEINPAIHPSGDYLVYSHRSESAQQFDLVLANKAGKFLGQLTQTDKITELRAAWSADGQHLAYISHSALGCQLILLRNVLPLKELYTPQVLTECSAFDVQVQWHPDGKRLLFNRRAHENGPLRVYEFHLSDSRISELTQANQGITGDIAFALSPSGDQLAVLRTFHWNQSSIWLKDLITGVENKQIDLPYWIQSLSWGPNGKHLYFVNAPLYQEVSSFQFENQRIESLFTRSASLEDPRLDVGSGMFYFVQKHFNADIDVINNPVFADQLDRKTLVNSTLQDWQPSLNSAGTQLAFMSDRSGDIEIWLLDLTTQKSTQLTNLQGQKIPYRFTWVDNRAVVFDANDDRLYYVDVKGGGARSLTNSESANRNPIWTEDGLYFSSTRSGEWQLWRLTSLDERSQAEQVSELSIFSGQKSLDPRQPGLIYTKFYQAGFWHLSDDGVETQFLSHGSQGPFNQWQQTESGIYYLASGVGGLEINFFDYAKQTHQQLVTLPSRELVGFSVSKDQQKIYLTWVKDINADIWRHLAF